MSINMAQKIDLLDCPDEVLMNIFCIARGPVEYQYNKSQRGWRRNFQGDFKTIQNLRLTNRRFRNISSKLLVRHITVYVHQPASIKKLELIWNHSNIRLGVEYVQICMERYSEWVARSDVNFAWYCIDGLQLAVERADSLSDRAIENARSLQQSCRSLTLPPLLDSEAETDDSVIRHVCEARGYYEELCLSQGSRYELGIQQIATAMTRMPLARRLILGERRVKMRNSSSEVDSPILHDRDLQGTPLEILARFIKPTSRVGGDDCIHVAHNHTANPLIDLPLRIGKAVRLKELAIQTNIPVNLRRCLTNEKRDELRAVTNQLCSIRFEEQPRPIHGWQIRLTDDYLGDIHTAWGPETQETFIEYFTCFLTSPSMSELILNCRSTCQWPLCNMGPILSSAGPQLQYVDFTAPFYEGEVEEFLARADRTDTRLTLNGLLLRGTWEHVIDMLRLRVSKLSVVGARGGRFIQCDWETLTPQQKKHIASEGPLRCKTKADWAVWTYGNLATFYVRGQYEKNPFREVREEGFDPMVWSVVDLTDIDVCRDGLLCKDIREG